MAVSNLVISPRELPLPCTRSAKISPRELDSSPAESNAPAFNEKTEHNAILAVNGRIMFRDVMQLTYQTMQVVYNWTYEDLRCPQWTLLCVLITHPLAAGVLPARGAACHNQKNSLEKKTNRRFRCPCISDSG